MAALGFSLNDIERSDKVVEIGSSYGGLSSVETLVQQYMAQERRPVQDLEDQKSELNRKMLVFNDLKSKLTALRNKAKDFTRTGSLNTLSARKAVLSDSSYFSVSANSSAALGSHSIFVDRTATQDTGVSRQLTAADTWSFATGVQEFTIALGDGEAQTISVNLDPADTNLDVMNKVADAIKASGVDVTASVINDTADTARLIIKSNKEGAENYLNMTEVGGSNILRKLKYLANDGSRRLTEDAKGGFITQNVADLDAKFRFDGVEIIKSTNEIDDILEGVTIKLTKAHEAGDAPVSFSIESDGTNIREEINTFIEKYNEAIKYLNEKTSVDTVNFIRGDLAGDLVFNSLRFSMRSILSTSVEGLGDGFPKLLSQIGIEADRDGTISIKDTSKFNDAIEENVDHVTQLFMAEDGVAAKLEELLDTFVDTGGRVDRSKKGLDRQISSIDTRISNYETRLVIREENLRNQFMELQKALSALNSQQSLMMQYQTNTFQSY